MGQFHRAFECTKWVHTSIYAGHFMIFMQVWCIGTLPTILTLQSVFKILLTILPWQFNLSSTSPLPLMLTVHTMCD